MDAVETVGDGVGAGEELVEGVHESVVAAAVACVAFVGGFLDVDGFDGAFFVVAEPEFGGAGFVVGVAAFEGGLGAVDFDGAAEVEGGHGVGGGDAVGHGAGEDLVVYDVVVALVDAASPGGGVEEVEDLWVGGVVGAVHDHAEPASFVGEVAVGVVVAGGCGGAAVGAAFWGAWRGVFGAEPGAVAVAGEGGVVGVGEPAEHVGVVGAFGDDHGCGFGGGAPVSADEGVGLVVGFYAFVGADGDDAAEFAGVDDGFDGGVEGCVAEDEAEGDAALEFFGEIVDLLAAFEGFGGGFFEEDVVAEVEGLGDVVEVLCVLGADDEDVGEFAGGEEVGFVVEGLDGVGGGEVGYGVAADGVVVCCGGDGVSRGEGGGDFGVGATTGAAAEDGDFE